jgi:integrase
LKKHVIMFLRGNRWYGKVRGVTGKWEQLATGFRQEEEEQAEKFLRDAQRRFDAERERNERAGAGAGPMTVRRYVAQWLKEREALGHDWKHDRGRLEAHVLPVIGDMPLADVHTQHLVDLVRRIRTTPSAQTGEPVAQRTVYNIYAVVSALFRDARLAGLIGQSPCILTERQLGPKRDKDPEWRKDAVFTRDEATAIISSPQIPADRRVVYALELLAGVRPGEAAALRWRHYEAAKQPLGELFVALAFSTRQFRTKSTKTDSVKYIPVHPTLAAILAEWKLAGWAEMMGRPPGSEDLIVPLPPADAAARVTRREAEPFRPTYYSARRWRDEDLPALGFRPRRHYDMRATFITLALEDGADEHILETRVTHTKKSRSAFDGYNRGRQWEIVCRELAKLRLHRSSGGEIIPLPAVAAARFGAVMVQSSEAPAMTGGDGLRRRGSKERPSVLGGSSPTATPRGHGAPDPGTSADDGGAAPRLGAVRSACDLGLAVMRAAEES